ncbi:MAG: GNAT family N-acetyltransferase [Magnetococcales bacterium]|nr:GNAT family N-acetyltransferase [Magnetococcales bacterium]
MSHFFLGSAWMEVMRKAGHIHRSIAIHTTPDPIWLGESALLKGKYWHLYGTPEPNTENDLRQILYQAKRQKAITVQCRYNMARWVDREMLERNGCQIIEPFGTWVIDLTQDLQTLWNQLHPHHRRLVRKAMRLPDLEMRPLERLQDLVPMLESTYQRGGKSNPFSMPYLEAVQSMEDPRLIRRGVYFQDRLIAGLVVPYDAQRGYFLHGGIADDAPGGISAWMHWQIFALLRELSIPEYDLGGARPDSPDPRLRGISLFKERFGGTFKPCWYFESCFRPWTRKVHSMVLSWGQ